MAQLGMVGLGRMGANIVRRLMKDGHECVVYDVNPDAVKDLAGEGAIGVSSLAEMAEKLDAPRSVWVMVPAGEITEKTVAGVADAFSEGDAIIDGGNTHYHDDIRRSNELAERGIDYIDCGTSGGVWGLERGYCLMIGGPDGAVERLDPIFAAVAPVNAPFSCPKSSDSSRFSCSAAQLTLTKLRVARSELWWTAPAISSLPVPVSPRIRQVVLLLATFLTMSSTWRRPGLEPTMRSKS